MPNAAPRPWKMFLPLGAVLVLALLWSIFWFFASGMARDRFTQERLALAAQGLTLSCTEERWGGFPFHFEFSCSSPRVAYKGEAELRSSSLLLVALAYAPWQVAALVDGPTTLSGPGVVPTTITHERALAAVTLGGGGQPSLSAELPAVSVPGIGQADKLMLFTRPSSAGGTDVAVEGSGIAVQAGGRPAIHADTANLLGTLQADRSFKLDKFDLRQGQLGYWGSGTLALDAQNRIAGQIATETNDARALLELAGPQLGLSDNKLANLRTMLGLLGSDAKAPIIAKDGLLFLGPFQIAELKPVY